MVRPRRTVPVNPPEPDFVTIVANLQRQLLEQQQETDRLRGQIAQMNQRPQVNEVPPPVHQVPPVVPPVPEVQPEVQPEVPIAPVGVQINPSLVREDLLYERFRRMKAPEFEGPTDPIVADNWLIDIQVILDFMRLTEQEKVLCASLALKKDARHWWMTVQMRRDVTLMNWQDFVTEFRTMYYNQEVLAAQQDEFMNLKQGSMIVIEAVKKFEQLARLCPELVPSETEKVRMMMKMFRTDISKQVSAGSSPPTPVSDCPRQNAESFPKRQNNHPAQSSKQFGRNKRKGNFTGQGQQQRNYPQRRNNQGNEARIEGPSITQGRLEAPEPQARIYTYTNGDAEAGTSHVVTR
ncbi:hypothetical protein TIFTF001_043654 [Ficus carica]|uniref:Retrotransposon gag domain-containing protein n=1 Tax=Ficus carica TaxID=3494 RepID=A0AA87YU92_FICCA|nr:hypothetical protein TIFTF001_043654 [Ficus carica]